MVPIVSEIGAPDERIVDGVNGFKVPVDDAGALVELFNRLANEPERMRACHENVRQHHVHLPDDHVRAMGEHYAGLLKGRAASPVAAGRVEASLTLADCGVVLEEASWCGMPTLGYASTSVGKPGANHVPTAEAASGALLTESPEQETFDGAEPANDHAKPSPDGAKKPKTGTALYAPTYLAGRFVRLTREHGLAYTLNWHVKTVKKMFGGSKQP